MKALYLPFVLFLLFIAACTPQNLSFSEAMEHNNQKLETEAERADANFLVEATDYNLLLREISETASTQAYSRMVTDFAAQNLQDHQQMGEKLRTLAKEKKIALPATMSERHQEMVSDIKQADKRNIDRIYLNTIEILHERLMRTYEQAALNANDAEARSYAAAQLDIIRTHNRRAQELRKELI
jgi:putative membrane protein